MGVLQQAAVRRDRVNEGVRHRGHQGKTRGRWAGQGWGTDIGDGCRGWVLGGRGSSLDAGGSSQRCHHHHHADNQHHTKGGQSVRQPSPLPSPTPKAPLLTSSRLLLLRSAGVSVPGSCPSGSLPRARRVGGIGTCRRALPAPSCAQAHGCLARRGCPARPPRCARPCPGNDYEPGPPSEESAEGVQEKEGDAGKGGRLTPPRGDRAAPPPGDTEHARERAMIKKQGLRIRGAVGASSIVVTLLGSSTKLTLMTWPSSWPPSMYSWASEPTTPPQTTDCRQSSVAPQASSWLSVALREKRLPHLLPLSCSRTRHSHSIWRGPRACPWPAPRPSTADGQRTRVRGATLVSVGRQVRGRASLTFPNVPKISFRCSTVTFLKAGDGRSHPGKEAYWLLENAIHHPQHC